MNHELHTNFTILTDPHRCRARFPTHTQTTKQMTEDGGGTPPPKGLQQVADVMKVGTDDGRAQQVWGCVQDLCLSASPEGLKHIAATREEVMKAMREEGGLQFGLASRFVSNACERVRAQASGTSGDGGAAQGASGPGSSKGKRSHKASPVDALKVVHEEAWWEGLQVAQVEKCGWDAKYSTPAYGKRGGMVDGAARRGQPRELTPLGHEKLGNIGRRLSSHSAWGAVKSQYPFLASLAPHAQADEASKAAAWALIEPHFKDSIRNYSEQRKNPGGEVHYLALAVFDQDLSPEGLSLPLGK